MDYQKAADFTKKVLPLASVVRKFLKNAWLIMQSDFLPAAFAIYDTLAPLFIIGFITIMWVSFSSGPDKKKCCLVPPQLGFLFKI